MKRHGKRCLLLEVVLFFFFFFLMWVLFCFVLFFSWLTCGIKGKKSNEGISRRPSMERS